MVVLYVIAYHGQEDLHLTVCVKCTLRASHRTQKYGAAVVVFDGYNDEPATKDATQLRRAEACAGVTLYFDGDKMIQSKKEDFLNNKANKQQFIHYLSNKLERVGCSIDHATHDADVLIVQTAVASAQTKDNVLIGMTHTFWFSYCTMSKWTHTSCSWHQSLNKKIHQQEESLVHKTIQGVA